MLYGSFTTKPKLLEITKPKQHNLSAPRCWSINKQAFHCNHNYIDVDVVFDIFDIFMMSYNNNLTIKLDLMVVIYVTDDVWLQSMVKIMNDYVHD